MSTATTTPAPAAQRPDLTREYDSERRTVVLDGTPWGIGASVLVVDGWFSPSSRHSDHSTLADADAYADAVHAAWTAGVQAPPSRRPR